MPNLFNVEWLNANSQRSYPLADDATGKDQTGSFVIPDDFLVEMDLPISAGMDLQPAQFYVLNIGSYAGSYTLVIGYNSLSGPVPVASAAIPRAVHTRNQTYALGGIAPFDDTTGKVTIGRLDSIDLQPAGFFTFDFADTRLEPDVIRPQIQGVTALIVTNGTQTSSRLTGDVELVAGANMQLVPILQAGQDPIIQFSAISGEGTIEPCSCTGDTANVPCIQRINGISATDFTIIGDDCLSVTATGNGLVLSDQCCQPCCGCAELEAITRDQVRFSEQLQTLSTFLGGLEASVVQMGTTVLGARLGDRSCVTCG